VTRNVGAQSGEDQILTRIFRKIRPTNKFAVEFGALDGRYKSNTLYFRERGWEARLFDCAPLDPMVTLARITAENVNQVFADAGVPHDFDLLSIDIDGNDLWVWKALTYRPRVVIIEYNPRWSWRRSRTVSYDPDRLWDGTIYYGASIQALCRLAEQKGYELVASTRSNLVFVLAGLYPKTMKPSQVRRPSKIKRPDPQHRKWVAYA
jgi:hypothetical protein